MATLQLSQWVNRHDYLLINTGNLSRMLIRSEAVYSASKRTLFPYNVNYCQQVMSQFSLCAQHWHSLLTLWGANTHRNQLFPAPKAPKRSMTTKMRPPQVNKSFQLLPLSKHHNPFTANMLWCLHTTPSSCQAHFSRTINSALLAGVVTSQGDGWGQ